MVLSVCYKYIPLLVDRYPLQPLELSITLTPASEGSKEGSVWIKDLYPVVPWVRHKYISLLIDSYTSVNRKYFYLAQEKLAKMFGAMMIFQSMNYDKSISLNLKYQRFTITGCTEIGIRKFEFGAKTQFLWRWIYIRNPYSKSRKTKTASYLPSRNLNYSPSKIIKTVHIENLPKAFLAFIFENWRNCWLNIQLRQQIYLV